MLNLPLEPKDTSVASLLVMLDHFAESPDDYYALLNGNQTSRL